MTQQLEAPGREREEGLGSHGTHQPSGRHRGQLPSPHPTPPALVIIQLGAEQATGDRGPQHRVAVLQRIPSQPQHWVCTEEAILKGCGDN